MERFIQGRRTEFHPWDVYRCPIDPCFETFGHGQQLLTHYRKYHQKDANFRSRCLFSQSCFHGNEFKSFDALYKHLKLYHAEFFHAEQGPVVLNNEQVVPAHNFFEGKYLYF